MVGPADEGHAAAARVQQVLGGGAGRLLAVGHDGGETVGQADAVEEDEGHVDVCQGGPVAVVRRFLREAGDDALHAHVHQIFDVALLVFVGFVRGGDDDEVAVGHGRIFDAAQDGGEEVGHDVGHDDADDARRVLPQAHGEGVGAVVHLLRQPLGPFAQVAADVGAVLQRSRHGGDGYAQHPGQVFQGGMFGVFHGLSVMRFCCKENIFQANMHGWARKICYVNLYVLFPLSVRTDLSLLLLPLLA